MKYKSNASVGPSEIGGLVGVSHCVGKLMSFCIIPKSGIPISCGAVQKLTELEKQKDEYKEK